MRRILRSATLLLVLVTFLMPFLECFDTWDKPGLTNDTEFPVFLIVLVVAFVILAVVAMAHRALNGHVEITAESVVQECFRVFRSHSNISVATPAVSPPLRI